MTKQSPLLLSRSKLTPTAKAAKATVTVLRATATGYRVQYAATLSAVYSHGRLSSGSDAPDWLLEGVEPMTAAVTAAERMPIVSRLCPPYSATRQVVTDLLKGLQLSQSVEVVLSAVRPATRTSQAEVQVATQEGFALENKKI